MALNDYKITGSTPVRSFPEKYNGLIEQLVTEIDRLKQLVAEKDAQIQQLRTEYGSAVNNLRAEYLAMFDQKMDEFESKFVKKTNN